MGKEHIQLGGEVGEHKASKSGAWQEAVMQHGREQTLGKEPHGRGEQAGAAGVVGAGSVQE